MSIANKKSNNFWLKLKKKSILALAPMAGITDSAFRQMCRKFGAGVVYTEMVSADGLYHDSKRTLEFLKFDKSEHPIVIQLFGKHPEKFVKAAKLCEEAGFDGIDINFGCPAKKVAGHGGGVTLMRDLPKCREIIEAVLSGTSLPVSVKLRSLILLSSRAEAKPQGGGPELPIINTRLPRLARPGRVSLAMTDKVTAFDFLKFMSALPLAEVMIHGRPYENPFNAEIDYEMIKQCVEFCKEKMSQTIVLGNGGIKSPEDAKKMIDLTGCAGVGLAQGLYGRPWLFRQCRDYFRTGTYEELTQKQIKKAILEHAKLAFRSKGRHGLVELRKHLLWYVSGWPNAKELRLQLVQIKTIEELEKLLQN